VRGFNGAMLVPMTMGSAHKLLLLDTGGFFGELTPQTVAELGLRPRHVRIRQIDVEGNSVDHVVDVNDVSLGTIGPSSMQFMVAARDIGGKDSKIAGTFAPNILSAYDLDLDFPHSKLQLMSQDHCPAQVIYWPHGAVALIPMQVTESNHIVFPMELDGHRLQAMLDTGASQTTLSLREAQVIGVDTSAPDVEAAGQLTDKVGSKIYRHRFKTLSVNGITVNNPMIYLIPDMVRSYMVHSPYTGSRLDSSSEPQGLPDLLLGMSVLQYVHVYVAYGERMLYITASETASSPARGGGLR
jgi:predicted aspartyl protease